VLVDDDHVTWLGFSQPFRPQRDYGSFGPLTFRRSQYERAVRDAANCLIDRGTGEVRAVSRNSAARTAPDDQSAQAVGIRSM
jgi:hypothetical protein